jgi:hypothetical protein
MCAWLQLETGARESRLKPRLFQNLVTFSDIVPSTEFSGFCKAGLKFRCTKFDCPVVFVFRQPTIVLKLALDAKLDKVHAVAEVGYKAN